MRTCPSALIAALLLLCADGVVLAKESASVADAAVARRAAPAGGAESDLARRARHHLDKIRTDGFD